MIESMLVRTATGSWERLEPRTSAPVGGLADVFGGDDVAPVFGHDQPLVVASTTGIGAASVPGGVCIDAAGGIWVVQMALDGDGAGALPELLSAAGELSGLGYAAFEQRCERRGDERLAPWMAARTGIHGFDEDAFTAAVTDSLAAGRLRLVSVVRTAHSTLIQSMRFFTASGARGSIFEVTSFASPSNSISAIRARAVDLAMPQSADGSERRLSVAPSPETAAEPAPAPAAAAPKQRVTPPAEDAAPPRRGAASKGASTSAAARAWHDELSAASSAETARLAARLQEVCTQHADEVHYGSGDDGRVMDVQLAGADDPVSIVRAASDGSVVVSFESLGPVDPTWSVRAELCQGLERLLGTDLGDVRTISTINLSIDEHLMDITLMDAFGDLLGDTVEAIAAVPATRAATSGSRSSSRGRSREGAAA